MQRAVPGGQRWFASLIANRSSTGANQQDYQQRQQKKKQPAYDLSTASRMEHNRHGQSLHSSCSPSSAVILIAGSDLASEGSVVSASAMQRWQVSQRTQAELTRKLSVTRNAMGCRQVQTPGFLDRPLSSSLATMDERNPAADLLNKAAET